MTDLKPADALAQQAPLGPPASSPAAASTSRSIHPGWRSRGYLPHCDAAQLVQHIVFGLADALPGDARPPSAMHGDRALDLGHGACILRNPVCARFVEDALLHADGTRYRLIAWCVMPNHVHAIAEQIEGYLLGDVVQGWKSTSAHRINHQLGRRGRLWRREYFDRFMRDNDHLNTSIAYVEENPVRAKLTHDAIAWPWSSARLRAAASAAGGDAGGPRT